MGGISIWQLVIIAIIVILLFGTKKLRGIGGDLGGAIKGFKKAIKEDEIAAATTTEKVESKDDASFEQTKSTEKSIDKDKA